MAEVSTDDRGQQLPEYDRPPVVEVVLGLTFEPLSDLGYLALADLRTRWAADYPQVQEQPALPAPQLGPQFGPPMTIETGLPPMRIWLQTRSGDRVVQVQRDRLILNWRAQDSEAPYPRFSFLREEFEARLRDFLAFAEERLETGEIKPLAVEVTYINELHGDADNRLGNLLRSATSISGHAGHSRQEVVYLSFDTSEADGRSSALGVNVQPIGGPDDLAWTLQIVYQGLTGNLDDAWLALDQGHRHVVLAFSEVTSDEAQNGWGKK